MELYARRFTAAELLVEQDALPSTISCGDVQKRFDLPGAPPAFALEHEGSYGLIDRVHCASILAQRFGRELYERKPVAMIMDPDPLVVDVDMSLGDISAAIADSKPSALQNCFLITEDDVLRGIGVGLDLVRLSARQSEEVARQLREMQASLVRSEKLASLGGLVGGVAHEINTPIGITLTAATQFEEALEPLRASFAQGTMRKSDLERYIANASETARLIVSNAQRAAELVQSFKQVAVDQTSDERRRFNVQDYLNDILLSLRPAIKRTQHAIVVKCDPGLTMDSYPGALSQVITNLLTNALIHAFEDTERGTVTISARELEIGLIEMIFADDGKGIPADLHDRVFDPFFTTKRGSGGSGLGLNIVHNIVTRTLRGRIWVQSDDGQGARFVLHFPRSITDIHSNGEGRLARFGGTAP